MLKIEPIPAFNDNYIWCLFDDSSKQALVVDPGEAAPVLARLADKELQLAAILITHHHFDHVGGLDDLLQRFPNAVIYGPQNPSIPQITQRLQEGNQFSLLGFDFSVLEVPGHTLDHIAFYAENVTTVGPILFCGDTLFAGGCGRLFEGSPAMMLNSLDKLCQLPAETRVYCAHEYTLSNLAFAKAVEPDNSELEARLQQDKNKREQNLPTVPSTLATELQTNPFLRARTTSVKASAAAFNQLDCQDAEQVFAAIRSWKDNF